MTLDAAALDLIFRNARSINVWLPKPVTDDQVKAIYEVMKWGPTSANSSPARILFLRTPAAKERVRPALSAQNAEKTMSAPVVAIIGNDSRFYENLPQLFAHNQTARSWFEGDDKKEVAAVTAMRNATLQGAYFIIAARALGLDCGPMSGFDNGIVDKTFFADGRIKSNFICNIGYADRAKIMPRNPRLTFDEACQLL
ncbi:MAG: malonic semialdehyde reductase [Betaproteobacteria bacterium]|nr:malonic semialdehyde reductase [Betaproteobacteria bacterium]